MNSISIIRFSTEDGFNQKLRQALAGTFDPRFAKVYPLVGGTGNNMAGVVSSLVTTRSFTEMVEIVRAADCGETVTVIDNDAMLIGDTSAIVTILPSTTNFARVPEETISGEIDRLLEKQRTSTLTADEQDRLTRLLMS